jgi:hypothetical protein
MNIEINKINEIKKQAFEQTNKDTFQAMEALIANLNSLFSRSRKSAPVFIIKLWVRYICRR